LASALSPPDHGSAALICSLVSAAKSRGTKGLTTDPGLACPDEGAATSVGVLDRRGGGTGGPCVWLLSGALFASASFCSEAATDVRSTCVMARSLAEAGSPAGAKAWIEPPATAVAVIFLTGARRISGRPNEFERLTPLPNEFERGTGINGAPHEGLRSRLGAPCPPRALEALNLARSRAACCLVLEVDPSGEGPATEGDELSSQAAAEVLDIVDG